MAKFQPIDENAFERISARTEKSPLPFAIDVRFDRRSGELSLSLNTGLTVLFDPRTAHGLEDATDDDLAEVNVEGAGDAIHFAKLDADFSVSRLLEGFLGPLEWARRERRAEASRDNGKLGGRKPKVPAHATA